MKNKQILQYSCTIKLVTILMILGFASQSAHLHAAEQLPLLSQPELSLGDNKDLAAMLQQAFPSFTKNLIDYLSTLNYNTAQSATIAIPNMGYSLNASWGFGGSGSVFEPLPHTLIALQAESATPQSDAFSLKTLGSMIVNDGIIANSQQLPILKWFANKRLSPLNLFSLKMFLLIKDFKLGLFDKNFVNAEISRLMIRLALALDQKAISSITKLSSLIPSFLGETTGILTPEVQEILEEVVKHLTQTQPTDVASFEKFLPKTTFACSFPSKEAADLYFESLEKSNPERITRGSDVIVFKDNASPQSSQMPAELNKEVQAAQTLPALIRAQDDKGSHWIGYVTNQLDTTDTIKMLCSCFMSTMKQYVSARKTFFASNPQASKQYAEKLKIEQVEAQRIYAFINSDAGKASTERINKGLDPKVPPIDNDYVQTNIILDSKLEKLNTLRADQNQALLILENYRKNNFDQKTIAALENDIAERQRHINAYQEYIETETMIQTTSAAQSAQDLNNQLSDLNKLAAQFKKSGEPVPAELSTIIDTMQKNWVQQPTTSNNNSLAIADFIKQQEVMVTVYEQEIVTLNNELNQERIRCLGKPYDLYKVAQFEFDGIIKPRYEAYIKHLSSKIDIAKKQIDDINTLLRYREIIKTNGATLAPEQKQKHMELERLVGWKVDNRPSEGIIHNLLNTGDVKELVSDVFGETRHFAKVREHFLAVLHMILKKSTHVQAMPHTYGYLISKFAPEYLETFNTIVE